MKGLILILLVTLSFNVYAGFEARNGGASLKIFDKINCSTGMTCSRSSVRGVLDLVSAPTGGVLTDGKILMGNGSNVSTAVTPSGDATITNAGVIAIGASKVTSAMIVDATIVVADVSATDSFFRYASGTITAAALVSAGTGVPVLIGPSIPDNSVVLACFYEVATTFLGDGDDSSTISIGLEDQDNDVVAAAAIQTGTTWDAAGPIETILKIETSTTFLKLSAARQIAVTLDIIATDTTLSAGSMDISCLYMPGI